MKFAEALDQVQTRVVGRDGLETQHFLSSDLEPRWKDAVVFLGAKHHQGFTLQWWTEGAVRSDWGIHISY